MFTVLTDLLVCSWWRRGRDRILGVLDTTLCYKVGQ